MTPTELATTEAAITYDALRLLLTLFVLTADLLRGRHAAELYAGTGVSSRKDEDRAWFEAVVELNASERLYSVEREEWAKWRSRQGSGGAR